jgi:hypothetical protein
MATCVAALLHDAGPAPLCSPIWSPATPSCVLLWFAEEPGDLWRALVSKLAGLGRMGLSGLAHAPVRTSFLVRE